MSGWFNALLGAGSGTDIQAVQSYSDISVPKTVPFTNLQFILPYQALVTLNNLTQLWLVIQWAEGSYDEDASATYTLTGTLVLSGGATNGLGKVANIDIEVVAALDPDGLDNQVLYVQENYTVTGSNVDQWTNDWNSSNDLLKVADATRPNANATGLNGNPSIEYTRANNDILRSEVSLGLTGNFSALVLFKCTDPTIAGGQYLIETSNSGAAFVNTGIQAVITTSTLRVDFRKNDAGDQQSIIIPFTNTGWNVLEFRHISNLTQSTLIVKLNGSLIDNRYGKDAVVFNSNLLGVGKAKSGSNSLGGSLSSVIINSDLISSFESKGILTYLKNRGGSEVSFSNYYDENNLIALNQGIVGEAWNGLDSLLRDDGKYDFIGATLLGKIYYFTQGATINDWTSTLLVDTGLEIQSLKILGRDGSDRLILLTLHKDGVTPGDNTGKLMLHRADTSNDVGAYSSVNLKTSRTFPQNAVVYDWEGNGKLQFFYSYQGTSSGQGGIRRFTCNNLADVLDPSDWVETNVITHESAWWCMRANISGDDGVLFTARTNNRNSAEIPGVYFIPDGGVLVTIDSTDLDFSHLCIGDFLGNGNNDIIVANFTNDDIYVYDAGNSYTKSTLITGGTADGSYNLKKASINYNGRSGFIHIVVNQWAYRTWWNGTSWERTKIFSCGVHPADNEGIHIDADNSGTLRWFMDFSTDLVEDNVRCFI